MDGLKSLLREFKPEAVLHLAARAECDENTTVETGYRANTVGTANLLEAVRTTPSVKRLIVTSTQYVCGPGSLPTHDEDYFPHTVYGESKVKTERLTRNADLNCAWTIIRPTNIWGPWHLRYRREFWKIAAKGLYVHPGKEPIVRAYGYVGNVVEQILSILSHPAELVDRRTFYVGDEPDDIYRWANTFCVALCGRSAPKIPRPLLRCAALLGDGISAVTKKPFYIQSSRYRSMVTDYRVDMSETLAKFGTGPFSLDDGVQKTARWLENYRPEAGSNR